MRFFYCSFEASNPQVFKGRGARGTIEKSSSLFHESSICYIFYSTFYYVAQVFLSIFTSLAPVKWKYKKIWQNEVTLFKLSTPFQAALIFK